MTRAASRAASCAVPEDTAYKVDASVAAFKKITSQNKVNFYYGDSTGFSKTINAELNRAGNILMTGASFATELNDPSIRPSSCWGRTTEMFGILLRYIAKEKPGAKVAFVYSDTEFGRSHRQLARRGREAGPEGGHRDHDAAGQRGRVHRGHRCAAPIRTTPSSTATCWRRFRNSSGRASAWA